MIRHHRRQGGRLNAAQIVMLSFLLFISLGTLILNLPISHQAPTYSWVDDLFMATSAVCVTGLVSVDPGSTYSMFGQTVLLLLIQLGGLGYMTLLTLSLVMVGQRISLRDRLNLQVSTDHPGMAGLIGFILHIVRFSLAFEALGMLLLATFTVPVYGWGRGLYVAGFHAVSAFNNAGFSLFPMGAAVWQTQPLPLLILMSLIIAGGLGYPVTGELIQRVFFKRRRHQWDTLIVVVLVTTAFMLLVPSLVLWGLERTNPETLGGLPALQQLVNAAFMAAQPRSAGFNTVPVDAMTAPSLLMIMGLMFIGGAPGGTAGGIKITTAVVLVAAVVAAVRGHKDIKILGLKRRVSEAVVRKALAVLVLSLSFLVLVTFTLLALEPLPFLPVLFEAVSAVGTVGLSLGITAQLSDPGKLIVALTMVIGRVGVIMVMLSLFSTRSQSAVRYPEEPMLVG